VGKTWTLPAVGIPADAQEDIYKARKQTEKGQGISPLCCSRDANCKESNTGTSQHNQPGSAEDEIGVKGALPSEPFECAAPVQAKADHNPT
jgi:hypothetical protein